MRNSAKLRVRLGRACMVAMWMACCAGRGAYADTVANCDAFKTLDSKASSRLGDADQQVQDRDCKTQVKNKYPVPDPRCTPGAINATLTVDILRDPAFRTTCVRDNATTPTEKSSTYDSYRIQHPEDNRGVMQTCELDHLVSLELGGADTLDNIWPQCGPPDVVLRERYFKQKDMVENYLAKQVRDGLMKLKDAQDGIAKDWTQYLDAATHSCGSGKCR
jgi:hypothetical protein